MRGALIRLTNVALFTMACWLVSVVFNQILAERLQPDSTPIYAGELEAAQSAPDWNDRKVIIDRNLFGAKVAREQAEPAPAPVVEEAEEVEETKLPLELLGTLWSSDPALSTAAIRDTGNRSDQVLLVGEFLEEHDGVQVAAIERGRVILLNGSRREELLLFEEGEQPGGGRRASVDSRSEAKFSNPAARRRAERSSRARAKAKKRASSGKDRFAEMNRVATGKQRPDPEKIRQSLEASGLIDSKIGSGANPDEIVQRMKEWEKEQTAGN
jgi:type II secretory pathway component PulC